MIISLYGQDSYRIGQKLNELIRGYKAKNPSGFNLINLDLAENRPDDFFESMKSDSLIPEKKLIIVKNIEKSDPKKLSGFIKSRNLSDRDDVILVAVSFDDLSKNKPFDYLIKKPNQSQNFKLLNDYEVKEWIKNFSDQFEVEFTGEALNYLILNYGRDLRRLDNEIRKIASFSAKGETSPKDGKVKGVVSKSQVEELIILDREHSIFGLTDALLRKDKKRALLTLHEAIESGEKPTELLGLLAWQVRNLLKFKAGATPASLKLHPFVLGKLKESAKIFSMEELSAFLSKIIDLDLTFKTTDLNEKTALSLLISEM